MPSTSSEPTRSPPRSRSGWRRLGRTAAVVTLALAAACSFAAPPGCPRRPVTPAVLGLHIDHVPPATLAAFQQDAPGRWSGRLDTGTESVAFHLRTTPSPLPRPVVLLVPILAGGAELMEGVAQRVAEYGFDVAYCARAGGALACGQRGAELDELFRRTVLHQRLLLRWLRERTATPTPQFVLGISLGGMVATVLAAHEPGLDGVAICLSGGDVADVIANSSEGRVRRWREWRRREDGIGDGALRAELQQFLRHEPLRYAPAVPTERVLLVDATLDTVVPRRNQDLLWEALGRPARYSLPLGHYTAALAIDAIIGEVAAHFSMRTSLAAAAPRRAPNEPAVATAPGADAESSGAVERRGAPLRSGAAHHAPAPR
jgi:dienelactone hydrolase